MADPSSPVRILKVAAALRPSHEGGARVERQHFDEGQAVVHNYGAGGTGYQAGLGMASDAVDMARDILHTLDVRTRI